jgi:hypothetical protein
LSKWDDRAAFHAFVRTSGLLWLDRVARYSLIPVQFTVYETIASLVDESSAAEEEALLSP